MKALVPIDVTELGIVNEVSLLFWNVFIPIDVKDVERVTEVS